MTAKIRTCMAALLGLWMVAGVAQEAAEENTAAADARQEVAPGAGSAAEVEGADSGATQQPEVIAAAGAPETDAVEPGLSGTGAIEPGAAGNGAVEPGEAFPEIAPLDELFVPSQNIRADEPVTFPVDF